MKPLHINPLASPIKDQENTSSPYYRPNYPSSSTNSTSSPSPSLPHFDEQVTIFSYLIIEEFLIKKNMTKTLLNFREEWVNRPNEMVTNLSWMNIALKLHLPELLKEETTLTPSSNTTATSSSSPLPPPPPSSSSSSSSTTGKNHAVDSKSIIEHINILLIKNSSLRLRNSPDVIVSGLADIPRKTGKILSLPPLSPAGGMKSSTISSSPNDSLNHENEKFDRIINEYDEELKILKKYKNKGHDIVNKYSSIHSPIRQDGNHEMNRKYRKNLHLTTLKPSTENWIPEIYRFRSIQRDLTTLETNLKSSMIIENELNRELKVLQVNELDKAHIEEELGVNKKISCGCCLQLFHPINLPMMIPIKAIIDIRKKWSNGIKGWWSNNDERIELIPKCYEGIKICTFCSQFFYLQETYRPSFEQIKKEEKLIQRNEIKRLEKQYWDPLSMLDKDRENLTTEDGLNTTGSGLPDDLHEMKGVTRISLE